MEAKQFLLDEHRKIRGLIVQLEAIASRVPGRWNGIAREALAEIEILARIKDEIWFKKLEELDDMNPETRGVLSQVSESNRGVLNEAREIRKLLEADGGQGADFEPRTALLLEDFERNLDHEEKVALPMADRFPREGLATLGVEMKLMRESLFRAPPFRMLRPEIVQNPNGGEQMRRKGAA